MFFLKKGVSRNPANSRFNGEYLFRTKVTKNLCFILFCHKNCVSKFQFSMAYLIALIGLLDCKQTECTYAAYISARITQNFTEESFETWKTVFQWISSLIRTLFLSTLERFIISLNVLSTVFIIFIWKMGESLIKIFFFFHFRHKFTFISLFITFFWQFNKIFGFCFKTFYLLFAIRALFNYPWFLLSFPPINLKLFNWIKHIHKTLMYWVCWYKKIITIIKKFKAYFKA